VGVRPWPWIISADDVAANFFDISVDNFDRRLACRTRNN
jgi:hypothetical protein